MGINVGKCSGHFPCGCLTVRMSSFLSVISYYLGTRVGRFYDKATEFGRFLRRIPRGVSSKINSTLGRVVRSVTIVSLRMKDGIGIWRVRVLSWWKSGITQNLNSFAEWKSWLVSISMDAKTQKDVRRSLVFHLVTTESGPSLLLLLLLVYREMVVGNYQIVVEKYWYTPFVVEVGIVERAIGDRDYRG
ncbi:hypothetical protein Tco_1281435 [Tanacetum coccineum]